MRRARFELTTRPLSDVEHISDLHQRAVGSTVELPAHNFFLAQASRMVGTLGFDPSQEHPSGAKEFINLSRVQHPPPITKTIYPRHQQHQTICLDAHVL